MGKLLGRILKHDLVTLAAALAFNTVLSLAPLVLIFLMLINLVGLHAQQQMLTQIQDFLGDPAAEAVRLVLTNADQKPLLGSLAGILGTIVLLFSASSVFAQLQSSLNVILEVDPIKAGSFGAWLKRRLLSIGIVLAFGFIAAVSLVFNAVFAFLFSQEGTLWHVVNEVVSVAVFTVLFGLIFSYLPDEKVSFRQGVRGGFITAVLFSIGKFLIGLYIGRSAVSSAYGAAGSLVVLLIWVYYSSFILFAGAELTYMLAGGTKERKIASR